VTYKATPALENQLSPVFVPWYKSAYELRRRGVISTMAFCRRGTANGPHTFSQENVLHSAGALHSRRGIVRVHQDLWLLWSVMPHLPERFSFPELHLQHARMQPSFRIRKSCSPRKGKPCSYIPSLLIVELVRKPLRSHRIYPPYAPGSSRLH
jgi:hypothetical protein